MGFDRLVLWQNLEGVWDISVYVWRMAVCGKVMDILDHGTAGKKGNCWADVSFLKCFEGSVVP